MTSCTEEEERRETRETRFRRGEKLIQMQNSTITSRTLMAVLTALVLIAAIVVAVHAQSLSRAIDERTMTYVTDVTHQLADDVNARIGKVESDLTSLADSLLRVDPLDEAGVDEFLVRKAEMLGFASLAVISRDGSVHQTGNAVFDPLELTGVQASFSGGIGVSFLDGQDLLYSVPIYMENRVVGVLGGVRSKANMQKIITTECFSGKSLTCIINQTGDVIISPTDVDPFMQLDSIFTDDPDSDVSDAIRKMEINMAEGVGGIFKFRSAQGKELILSYDPIDNFSWVLLTLVSSDVIASSVNGYMIRMYVTIGSTLVLMVIILLVLYRSQRQHYRQMERAAFVDSITGGMTNVAFRLRCEKLLPKAPAGTYSIVLLNIKNFKLINDYFGSDRGDAVLTCVMKALDAGLEGNAFAARADADSFFLCLEAGNRQEVEQQIDVLKERILRQIGELSWHQNAPYAFVLQPGAYVVEEPDLEITIMQDRAYTACRSRTAYEDGVCKFYDASMMARMRREEELNNLFDAAIAGHEFVINLQPKVNLKDGRIGGAEALVRWIHPQQGMIYPSEFIPLFEENGKICRLDLYVFEEACRAMQARMREGKPLYCVSINVSRQHFGDAHFLDTYDEIAGRYGIPRDKLELELTESIFFDEQGIENTQAQIREMHRLGFHCSLDDFGSGYSSLGLLVKFDIDVIKLDRRFFQDIANRKCREVIAAVAEMARGIGISTVAEGIETQEQLALLRDVGCDMVQGYIYSKPLSVADFNAWAERIESGAQPGAR